MVKPMNLVKIIIIFSIQSVLVAGDLIDQLEGDWIIQDHLGNSLENDGHIKFAKLSNGTWKINAHQVAISDLYENLQITCNSRTRLCQIFQNRNLKMELAKFKFIESKKILILKAFDVRDFGYHKGAKICNTPCHFRKLRDDESDWTDALIKDIKEWQESNPSVSQ